MPVGALTMQLVLELQAPDGPSEMIVPLPAERTGEGLLWHGAVRYPHPLALHGRLISVSSPTREVARPASLSPRSTAPRRTNWSEVSRIG
jgi:hypothetical protein